MKSIAIVGLGLIGGSMAKQIRESYPDILMWGVDTDADTVRLALDSRIFSGVSFTVESLPVEIDLGFICTPLSVSMGTVEALSRHVKSPAIFSDVASLKRGVSTPVLAQSNHIFIPGHPMAGTENVGFSHSNVDILAGATYFLCPPEGHEAPHSLTHFLALLGFKIRKISIAEHDRVVGLASHFPYVMASLTVSTCARLTPLTPPFTEAISSGFKDTTRISASSPDWGVSVCLGNSELMQAAISESITELQHLATWIAEADASALRSYFSEAQASKRTVSL